MARDKEGQTQDNSASMWSTYPKPLVPEPQLQFYAPQPESPSAVHGSISHGFPPSYGGNIQPPAGWWTAFGTGGFEGEPPLLQGLSLPVSLPLVSA